MLLLFAALRTAATPPTRTASHAADFEQLVAVNRGRLLRIASSYAQASGREDLYQEMLLQLWRSIDRFDGRAHRDTWVYRVALNTAISYRRKATRDAQLRVDHRDIPSDAIEDLHNRSDGERQRRILARFVGTLSRAERAVFLLYLEDLSYQDIAQVLGLRANHVGVRIHRLKQRFIDHCSEG